MTVMPNFHRYVGRKQAYILHIRMVVLKATLEITGGCVELAYLATDPSLCLVCASGASVFSSMNWHI